MTETQAGVNRKWKVAMYDSRIGKRVYTTVSAPDSTEAWRRAGRQAAKRGAHVTVDRVSIPSQRAK